VFQNKVRERIKENIEVKLILSGPVPIRKTMDELARQHKKQDSSVSNDKHVQIK
jgi:hypothetical protein